MTVTYNKLCDVILDVRYYDEVSAEYTTAGAGAVETVYNVPPQSILYIDRIIFANPNAGAAEIELTDTFTVGGAPVTVLLGRYHVNAGSNRDMYPQGMKVLGRLDIQDVTAVPVGAVGISIEGELV